MIANIQTDDFLIKIENVEGIVKITVEKDGEIVEGLELDPKEFEDGAESKEEGEETKGDLKTFGEYSEEGEESKEESEDENEEAEEEKEEESDEKVEESIKTFDKFFK